MCYPSSPFRPCLSVLCRMRPEEFGWKCANVLIGEGDPFSTAGAKAFIEAAEPDIDVCTQARYEAGSDFKSMWKPIKEIIDNRCCTATVVFGQTVDLAGLFVAAHEQGFTKGEWLVGDWAVATVDGIIKAMKRQLTDSEVHKFLRGALHPRSTEGAV